ncbi:MAG: hypothetical protein WDN46_25370 [Methylocella sp.]
MNGLRRAIVGLFGLVIAIATGLIVLPVAALLDPTTRQIGAAFAEAAVHTLAWSDSAQATASTLAQFLWTAIMAVCVVPVVIAVLIGEIARVRSFLWYAGATGALAASAPWLARAVFHTQNAVSASPEELRFAFVFFVTGAASGFVFWLIAGGDRKALSTRPN